MIIHEMTREDCLRRLAEARLMRLACVRENQPYVVPVYLAYDVLPDGEPCLYGFTTVGQKIEWMRANPLVCIEVDEVVASDQWASVIAFGRYEELHEAVGSDGQSQLDQRIFQLGRCENPQIPICDPRTLAFDVLRTQAMWWEPACTVAAARAHRGPTEEFVPVYYRVRIGRVTGHLATPDARPTAIATPLKKESWLRRTLGLGRSALAR